MEARVSALLQKLDKDLTLDKIEKLAIQQQEIMEHLQSLKVTPREPVDTANETDESGGKKTKKVQAKPKTFDELSDEVRFYRKLRPLDNRINFPTNLIQI